MAQGLYEIITGINKQIKTICCKIENLGPGGASVWGGITGTLSNQTDLQNALNAKFDDPTGTTSQYLRGDGSLATFPTIPAAQIQSDWTQTNNTALDFIKNKPIIPAAQVNSDWNAVSGVAQILNKPTIPSVVIATSGSSLYSTNPSTSGFSTNSGIFLGFDAGRNANGAFHSNFLGSEAGYLATNAYYSNFIGRQAGFQATDARSSNFIGYQAGRGAINASDSVFIGENSGINASGANRSQFLGSQAGNGATNAFNSNFIGFQAGQSATAADNSNFIGFTAGFGASAASFSNFIGRNSGQNATSASNSNFIGLSAGQNATSASNSNFLGQNAGQGATSANNSNFFGREAGMNSTGNNVNAFGFQAHKGGTLSGQTVFANATLPSFVDRAAAVAAITVALGAVAGNTYLYYNQTTFAIEGVRL